MLEALPSNFNTKLLETDSGYAATLFYDELRGKYVIADRGTEGFIDPDGTADLRQASGLQTEQYEDAIKLAEEAKRVFGADNIVTAGHSLGGGLASVQALYLGTTANTFNAAGVHVDTLQRLKLDTPEAKLAERGIKAYYVEGEILSRLQDSTALDTLAFAGFTAPKLVTEVIDEFRSPAEHDFNLGVAYVPGILGT